MVKKKIGILNTTAGSAGGGGSFFCNQTKLIWFAAQLALLSLLHSFFSRSLKNISAQTTVWLFFVLYCFRWIWLVMKIFLFQNNLRFNLRKIASNIVGVNLVPASEYWSLEEKKSHDTSSILKKVKLSHTICLKSTWIISEMHHHNVMFSSRRIFTVCIIDYFI